MREVLFAAETRFGEIRDINGREHAVAQECDQQLTCVGKPRNTRTQLDSSDTIAQICAPINPDFLADRFIQRDLVNRDGAHVAAERWGKTPQIAFITGLAIIVDAIEGRIVFSLKYVTASIIAVR